MREHACKRKRLIDKKTQTQTSTETGTSRDRQNREIEKERERAREREGRREQVPRVRGRVRDERE